MATHILIRVPRWPALVLITFVAGGFGLPQPQVSLGASQDSLAPAVDAISKLAVFQQDIGQASQTVAGVNLGPFKLSGSCDYECLGKLCFKTQRWSWTSDFNKTREPLQRLLAQSADRARNFDRSMQPIRTWLKDILPDSSHRFSAATTAILAATSAAGQGGAGATLVDRLRILAEFKNLDQVLEENRSQVDGAARTMASFNVGEDDDGRQLTSLRAELQNSTIGEVARAKSGFIDGLHCGGGDASNQINVTVSSFTAAFNIIQVSFDKVAADGQAVSHATQAFSGVLLNIQLRYRGISQQIEAAEKLDSGVIQNLHLDIASKEWSDLAQYATQQVK